jgi:hypothetical protein
MKQYFILPIFVKRYQQMFHTENPKRRYIFDKLLQLAYNIFVLQGPVFTGYKIQRAEVQE